MTEVVVQEPKKNVLKSRTFWFGILTAVAPLFPSVQSFIQENTLMMTSLWSALAIALRMITKDKVVLSE